MTRQAPFPMEMHFDEMPSTLFNNNLKNIKVTLESAPGRGLLYNYIQDFATATWEDDPHHVKTTEELEEIFQKILNREVYPGSLETINLVFLLEGISYQDVTHFVRYRTATFSVECSADKFWTEKNAVVPTSVENSPEFYDRYVNLIKDSKKLYQDMVDSRDISLMDARFVLTRAHEMYMWMSMSLKDILNLIDQRIDKMIQPDSDNVVAYLMIEQLIDWIPEMAYLFDLHKPSYFWGKTTLKGHNSDLYCPDEDNENLVDWQPEDYLYERPRRQVNGTDKRASEDNYPFQDIFNRVDNLIKATRAQLDSRK